MRDLFSEHFNQIFQLILQAFIRPDLSVVTLHFFISSELRGVGSEKPPNIFVNFSFGYCYNS
jgi:hypothetical protein